MEQGQSATNETEKMRDDGEDSDGPLWMNDLSATLEEDVDVSEKAGAQKKKAKSKLETSGDQGNQRQLDEL